LNPAIFDRVARWIKLSTVCLPDLKSEIARSKMSTQHWFLKNREPITAGRRGLSILGHTLSNPLKFAPVHWWDKIVRPIPEM
jgi:hypothetical protein